MKNAYDFKNAERGKFFRKNASLELPPRPVQRQRPDDRVGEVIHPQVHEVPIAGTTSSAAATPAS